MPISPGYVNLPISSCVDVDQRAAVGVLLHQVEGPINLGSVCRAMANTGFQRLRFSGELSSEDELARRFAVHAGDILDDATKCRDFESLIETSETLIGFSPRTPWPDRHQLLLEDLSGFVCRQVEQGRRVGLLFGNEARGLSNAELCHCHYRLALPAVSSYVSLNLAQAVLLVLWELHRNWRKVEPRVEVPLCHPSQVQRLLDKLNKHLDLIHHLNPEAQDKVWQEITQMFRGRHWTEREMDLLTSIIHKSSTRYRAALRRLEASAGD